MDGISRTVLSLHIISMKFQQPLLVVKFQHMCKDDHQFVDDLFLYRFAKIFNPTPVFCNDGGVCFFVRKVACKLWNVVCGRGETTFVVRFLPHTRRAYSCDRSHQIQPDRNSGSQIQNVSGKLIYED